MYGKKIILFLVGIMAVFLTCCGRQEEVVMEEEDVISDKYTVETIPLEAAFRPPVLAGEKVYYVKDNGEDVYTVCCMDIESGEVITETLAMEDRVFNLINFTADPEGNLYFALTIKPEDDNIPQWERYIMKWNAEWEEEYFRKVTEDLGASILQMQVDEQGRLSFRYTRTYRFDENGQYLGEEEYVFDTEEAHQFQRQKSSLRKFGINSEAVQSIFFMEDGRIEALSLNGSKGIYELFVLTPSESETNCQQMP